jgi:DNA-binding NtrC family response regulator
MLVLFFYSYNLLVSPKCKYKFFSTLCAVQNPLFFERQTPAKYVMMSKVKISIAEDDMDDFLQLLEAIEEVLPKFDIKHSRNGRDFMRSINEGDMPDLIFLDLNIPYKSGVDCLIEVRQKRYLKRTPVIIYSTSSYFEDIDNCYKHGCTLYLVKPPSHRDLITQIRKVFFRLGLPKKDLLDKERFVVQKQQQQQE